MDPTRSRNLIWLASTGSADRRRGGANLVTAWDVAVAQMLGARRAGDRAGAARWEAEANTIYIQITGEQPDEGWRPRRAPPVVDRGARRQPPERRAERGEQQRHSS